jgi:hypothetical protein
MPNSDGSPHFISLEHKTKGEQIAREIMLAVGEWQDSTPRTQQSRDGVLGFSDLGGCREYIRGNVQHDEAHPPVHPLKWAAAIGTAVGDLIETALAWKYGDRVITQRKLRLDLGDGIVIEGSADAILLYQNAVIDLKSKDGIAEVRRDGPSLKEWIQIAGYLVACIQAGILGKDATAHLMYYDRGGSDKTMHSATIDFTLALEYLELARTRLFEVADAIDAGVAPGDYLRDEPESWCFAVGCKFYQTCWPAGVYTPTEEITDPQIIDLVDRYDQARTDENEAAAIRRALREKLKPMGGNGEVHYVSGRTPRFTVKWGLSEGKYSITERLEVRARNDND